MPESCVCAPPAVPGAEFPSCLKPSAPAGLIIENTNTIELEIDTVLFTFWRRVMVSVFEKVVLSAPKLSFVEIPWPVKLAARAGTAQNKAAPAAKTKKKFFIV